jgi:hypothetical protein
MERAGGAVTGADECVLPVVGAAGDRGRDSFGLGTPGRVERDHLTPGQELAVGQLTAPLHLIADRPSGHIRRHRVGGTEHKDVDPVGQ